MVIPTTGALPDPYHLDMAPGETNRNLSDDAPVWDLAPRHPLQAFPIYKPNFKRSSLDPMTLELTVPPEGEGHENEEFRPAFEVDVNPCSFIDVIDVGFVDGWLGLLIFPVMILVSLFFGGIRWLFHLITRRRRLPPPLKPDTTSVVLTSEAMTCHTYKGITHRVQWTLIDSVWVCEGQEESLKIGWRLKATGEVHFADLGPRVERGFLASRVSMYAGPLYTLPWDAPTSDEKTNPASSM